MKSKTIKNLDQEHMILRITGAKIESHLQDLELLKEEILFLGKKLKSQDQVLTLKERNLVKEFLLIV